MRLLLVSTETRPIIGGVAQCLDAWLEGLAEQGHAVCMLSLLPADAWDKKQGLPPRSYREEWLRMGTRATALGDAFIPLRKARSAAFTWRRNNLIRRRFHELVEEFQPDRVFFCVLRPLCCTPLMDAHRRGLHCAGIAYGSEVNPVRIQDPRWLRHTLGQLDHLIAISDFTRHKLLEWGVPQERVSIVHPALSPDLVERGEGIASTHAAGPVRLLTICRLTERKGVQTVLAAIARLRSEIPELVYHVAGDGTYRAELERSAAELGVADLVRFHGTVSPDEHASLLSECDIFVMVPFEAIDGDFEGFGIVYLEAGWYGKPVVASRSGGVPDAVKDTCSGVLVPPGDVEATAKAIRELAQSPSRCAELGSNGKMWARAHIPAECAKKFAGALAPVLLEQR